MNISLRHRRAIAACAVIAPAFTSFAQSANFVGLGDLPGGNTVSFAFAVSDDGTTVVGQSTGANGQEAFRWKAGALVGLGDLPAGSFQSVASGVSANGSFIVGTGRVGPFNPVNFTEAFRWNDPGPVNGLGQLLAGQTRSSATGCSSDGRVVVGFGNTLASGGTQACRWVIGTGLQILPDLPGGLVGGQATGASGDGSIVVGWSFSTNAPGPGDFEAFRWREGVGIQPLGDLPGGSYFSAASKCSRDGNVIAGYSISNSGMEAVRFIPAGIQGLGDLPGGIFTSFGWAITDDALTVVGRASTDLGDEAFIWDHINGMRSLRSVLIGLGVDLTGWQLTSAEDITPDGTVIIGAGINPMGFVEAFRAVLPRPCRVDYNNDTEVDFSDIEGFLARFSVSDLLGTDLNLDGEVDFSDVEIFLALYNAGC